MNPPDKKLWFRAKRYGLGWYPSSWEGWLITLGFVILAVAGATLFEQTMRTATGSTLTEVTVAFVIYYTTLITLLIRISAAHGDPLKWRWGKD